MIRLSLDVDADGAKAILVALDVSVTDRSGLNQALSERLAEEIQDHFREKNRTPNKLGGRRTNFWSQAANATVVGNVTDEHGEVVIGGDPGQRVRIHLFGGTIVPKAAESLTIPLVREAHGLRVSEYEERTGKNVFQLPGVNVLFETVGRGGDRTLTRNTQGRRRGNAIALRARTELRPVYALTKSVTITQDPETLPDDQVLTSALKQEALDWLEADSAKGGQS